MFFHKKVKNLIDYNIELNRLKTLSVTGHRSQKLPWRFNEDDERCITMKKELKEQFEISINEGYDTFLSGMALGFDMICVETLLELKKKYKNIKIIGALPCKNQDCKWPEKEQKRYRKLSDQLDYIRCKYDEYNGAECMLERNRFMVDNSSKMIALFNGQNGGTKSTVDYAQSQGLNIVIIKS